MGSLPGIVFLIVGLLVSVGLHELGHLWPAKRFGVKVSQYFIGFGPTLWSRVVRGTEYGVKAIPLGGYVRIAGMLAPGRDGRVTVGKNGRPTIAEEARRASAEELLPEEADHAFWRLSAPKRLIVMFGGPFMNLVLAGVCLAIVLTLVGTATPSRTISTVVPCVTTSSKCSNTDPQSPAAVAGLEAGDTILSWGSVDVTDWADIQEAIAGGSASPTSVTIVRDGEEMSVTVTPVVVERPVYDSSGVALTNDDGSALTQSTPYVGISPGYTYIRQTLSAVPAQLWSLTTATVGVVAKLPVELWNTATGLITGAERSSTGVVGVVGVADLAGSITSSDSSAYTIGARIGDLLLLLASLNISLFVFNLVPLLPLDGGHIAGALYEMLRRAWAQVRGRIDPGPVDMARLMPLSYAVALAFIGMTVLLIVADVVNPVF